MRMGRPILVQFLDALANGLLRNFASCPIAFTLGIGFPPPVGATALLRSSVFSFLSVFSHGFSPGYVCRYSSSCEAGYVVILHFPATASIY